MLYYTGSQNFRYRLVLATLAKKPIKIKDIRAFSENPGVKDYEISLLRLLDKVTNGSVIEINETGTLVKYKPGVIVGGQVTHDCGNARGMGYFLEALILLAPFAKTPFNITLKGLTNHPADLSVDLIRTTTLPLLKQFGIDESLELKIRSRGLLPNGGGSVTFQCPIVRSLRAVQLADSGKITRVRGIAFSSRVSPQITNQVVDVARNFLYNFTQNVFIYSDHYSGGESGHSPGYGLCLVAETSKGSLLTSEKIAEPGSIPSDVAEEACKLLLKEVQLGGCVDTAHQSLFLTLMVLTPEDINKVRFGSQLTPHAIEVLRLLKDFFSITFKIDSDATTLRSTEEQDEGEEQETKQKVESILLTCRGSGFINYSKRAL